MILSLFHEDCHKKNKCKGCVCLKLENLTTGTPVFVRTIAGGIKSSIKGKFLNYDPKTCCAIFEEQLLGEYMKTIIDCNDIVSVSITNQKFLDNMQEVMSDIMTTAKNMGKVE